MQHKILKERVRVLRNNMTITEIKLWHYLRGKKLFDIRFRRQVILGNYIVEFLSLF